MEQYDVIIAGLGAMGGAAAYELARRNCRVLGFDRFAPPHTMGSSHGGTRIIRQAYFEDPLYVPLVQRAYILWAELQQVCGRRVLVETGGLSLGRPTGALVRGARASAHRHNVPYEEWPVGEIVQRVPELRPTDDMIGIWDPRAGVLFPEEIVASHLELARRHGADLRFDEAVLGWRVRHGTVEVTTSHGTVVAQRLVLAAGAWVSQLVPELHLPLVIERQVLHWFAAQPPARFEIGRFPVVLCEHAADRAWYAIPDAGSGLKVALHHQGATVTPATVVREATATDVARVRSLVRAFLPAADGPPAASSVCLYTNTPDLRFVIDAHPAHPEVLVASVCSGHGFKFASVVGEILADLALGRTVPWDLRPFALARFREAR